MKKRSFLLYPLSLIYGAVVGIKNLLYDTSILKSTKFDVPVVCVGNLTVGGTGKTPHIEYIIDKYRSSRHIAVISRGYKRKSSGFHYVKRNSTIAEVGDEPLQLARKFSDIIVAVDANRVRGIKHILRDYPQTNLILMDDGFQHRSIKPSHSIILTDYERIVTRDSLLPYGNLRESVRNLRRADYVIVSKMPNDADDNLRQQIANELHKYYSGKVYFSSLVYNGFAPLFPTIPHKSSPQLTKVANNTGIILLTGIANPYPLYHFLSKMYNEVKLISFPDHHVFTADDIETLFDAYQQLSSMRKFIVTTEKDAVRLRDASNIIKPIQPFCFYIKYGITIADR